MWSPRWPARQALPSFCVNMSLRLRQFSIACPKSCPEFWAALFCRQAKTSVWLHSWYYMGLECRCVCYTKTTNHEIITICNSVLDTHTFTPYTCTGRDHLYIGDQVVAHKTLLNTKQMKLTLWDFWYSQALGVQISEAPEIFYPSREERW